MQRTWAIPYWIDATDAHRADSHRWPALEYFRHAPLSATLYAWRRNLAPTVVFRQSSNSSPAELGKHLDHLGSRWNIISRTDDHDRRKSSKQSRMSAWDFCVDVIHRLPCHPLQPAPMRPGKA